MINLTYHLLNRTDLPVNVQAMDMSIIQDEGSGTRG
jgi:hypothetical protein